VQDAHKNLLETKLKRAVLEEKIRRAAKDKVDADRPPPELLVRSASSIPDQRIVSVFGGRLIRGAFQMLVGPGESGKGMSSSDLVARFSTGIPFPGEPKGRSPMSVIVCVTEDSAARVKARLAAAGADLDKVYFVDGPPSLRGGLVVPSPVAFDDDAGALLTKAKEVGAGALFLETMLEHLGDRSGRKQWSTNNEAEVRRALSPVVALCREAGMFGWGVMHPRKSQDGGIEDSISGSAAFRNIGRGVLHVYRDPKEPSEEKSPWRLLIMSKANYLAHRPPTLRFKIEPWEKDPTEGRVVWGIQGRTLLDTRSAEEVWRQIRDENRTRRDHTVRDAEDLLNSLLAESATKTLEEVRKAAQDANLSWRAIERAKEALKIESVKSGFPAVVVGWRLPKADL
jgi:putative DNA primase/helicase